MPKQRRNSTRKPVEILDDEAHDRLAAELEYRKTLTPQFFELPVSVRTIDELTEYFSRTTQATKQILPKERRRYVIYLRKSTDDESKQVRSLEDQRSECLELAKREQILIRPEDIFEESASAKISGNRPIFDEIIKGFITKKYHGLIAWSPDRLSRNMKEAGEIIELIDHEYIQDLQFKTYQFENNPNGKMLLGILFATSKQYSDKLSVDVKRGTDGNIKDGKYNGVVKKGYLVDDSTGWFEPDGYNWDLLREAVSMRLYHGKNNVEIAEFLNDSKLSVRKSKDEDPRIVRVDKQMVGDIFADTFYFGLYRYGGNMANLTELYNFMPLMTPDEYIALNSDVSSNFGIKSSSSSRRNAKLEYGLLRDKVICDYCDKTMQFQSQRIQRGKNKDKWVISFYCRNTECQRHKTEENKKNGVKLSKSIRAKYVMAAIEWQLRHSTLKSEKAYRMYIDKLKDKIAQDKAINKRKLSEAKNELRTNEQQYMKYQSFQVEHPAEYKKHHSGKLELHQKLINAAEFNISTLNKKIGELDEKLPTEEEFYELTKLYLLKLLNTDDLVQQDAICNELVSNLRAGNDSIPVIKLNPPYNLLVDLDEMSSGRRAGTPIEPILQALYDLLRGYEDIRGRVVYLENLKKSLIKPDRVKEMQFLL